MSRHVSRGFTLVEVMMAVVVLSLVALALSSTLITARRARLVSQRRMKALQLAAQGMEQLRTGRSPAPISPNRDDFRRAASITAAEGHPELLKLEVTVTWNDGQAHSVRLRSAMRR